MKNMLMTPPPSKDFCTHDPGMDKPYYPYGLKLCLQKEEIAKLGLSELPEMGEVFIVMAKAKVVEMSSSETHTRVELQITDLDLKEHKEKKSAEKIIYGS